MNNPKNPIYTYDDATGFFDAIDPTSSEIDRLYDENRKYFWGEAVPMDLPRSTRDSAATNFCTHADVAEYIGLTDSFKYCKKCNEKVT